MVVVLFGTNDVYLKKRFFDFFENFFQRGAQKKLLFFSGVNFLVWRVLVKF